MERRSRKNLWQKICNKKARDKKPVTLWFAFGRLLFLSVVTFHCATKNENSLIKLGNHDFLAWRHPASPIPLASGRFKIGFRFAHWRNWENSCYANGIIIRKSNSLWSFISHLPDRWHPHLNHWPIYALITTDIMLFMNVPKFYSQIISCPDNSS